VEKSKLPCRVWFWVASTLAVVVLIVGIAAAASAEHSWTMLAAGCVSVVALALAWPIWNAIVANRPEPRETIFLPLTERLDQISILLNLMSEQQLLSDRAISIAYRDKDRDALRRAVHEDMGRQDWDAALSLVDEMERAFGNKTEAQSLRTEINGRRHELVRKQINEVAQTIDKHTRAEQWNAAIREADKLISLYPDNEQARNLPHEIDNRRQAHKKQLLQNWHEAVARHDNDGSIEILKQLDPYLTPAEAETMQETVRGVFKEKLNSTGAQFAAAVKEQRWAEAIRIGEQISKEFPNSRIAQEVRDNMEILKKRAAEPAVATA
jgi:tetratricopeptide (TPR) repeat protein